MPTNQELAEQLKEERAKNQELVKSKAEIEAELTEKIANMEVPTITNGVTPGGIKVMTAEDYGKYSKENGRIMGRKPDQKTECTIEELRALINSNWSPKMVMEKHGIDADELKQLVWALSKAELRDKPIKYSIERDQFGREG